MFLRTLIFNQLLCDRNVEMKKVLVATVCLVFIGGVRADTPLEGEYKLSGPLTYQGATNPGKSHLYITLTSDAAKKLFESMEGKPVMDECTGMRYKAKGYVACHEVEADKKYICSFSIDLSKNTVGTGLGGCF